MVKHESQNVARTGGETSATKSERPRCVELSAFELEPIAGGGGNYIPPTTVSALTSAKR